MSKAFYMLEVAAKGFRDPSWTMQERIAYANEMERREKAVRNHLKARGHVYMKRVNAFATREEAEAAILQMGFPYKIEICKAEWAF